VLGVVVIAESGGVWFHETIAAGAVEPTDRNTSAGYEKPNATTAHVATSETHAIADRLGVASPCLEDGDEETGSWI
jgi:hypothetical protein